MGGGWANDSMTSSDEFQSMHGSLHSGGMGGGGQQQQTLPFPKIVLKMHSVVGVMHEKDLTVVKMGGEIDRSGAIQSMHQNAVDFFRER